MKAEPELWICFLAGSLQEIIWMVTGETFGDFLVNKSLICIQDNNLDHWRRHRHPQEGWARCSWSLPSKRGKNVDSARRVKRRNRMRKDHLDKKRNVGRWGGEDIHFQYYRAMIAKWISRLGRTGRQQTGFGRKHRSKKDQGRVWDNASDLQVTAGRDSDMW